MILSSTDLLNYLLSNDSKISELAITKIKEENKDLETFINKYEEDPIKTCEFLKETNFFQSHKDNIIDCNNPYSGTLKYYLELLITTLKFSFIFELDKYDDYKRNHLKYLLIFLSRNNFKYN